MDISNINKQEIRELLKEDKRTDGRKPFEFREIVIETNVSNNAEGTARVKIGKTEVIAGVKMETQVPYSDHDDEGTLMVGMEFSPICGKRYENGPPGMDSIEVARVIDRGIRESKYVDFKKLCIKKGERVWSILVDLYCINDDGNALDACGLAAVAALKLAKVPGFDEETNTVKYGEVSGELPLKDFTPITMTFHKIGEKLLVDPNRDEEDTRDSRITLTLSVQGKDKIVHSMQKGEIDSISGDELIQIAEESENVYDDLFDKIKKQIKGLEH